MNFLRNSFNFSSLLPLRSHSRIALTLIFAFNLMVTACSGSGSTAKAATPPVGQASTPVASLQPEPSASTYTVKLGDSALLLARRYLPQSSLMTVAELETAIRDANGLKKGA